MLAAVVAGRITFLVLALMVVETVQQTETETLELLIQAAVVVELLLVEPKQGVLEAQELSLFLMLAHSVVQAAQ
jgi:hypothetical protein